MSSWEERNRRRAMYRPVWNDMVVDQEPRQFFGVDANCFKLDGTAYEVIEDEDDGYRSSMDYVQPIHLDGKVFFGTPIDTVRIIEAPEHPAESPAHYYSGEFHGWQLVSVKDGHVWLTFGTDNSDDYYPSFTFNYSPRKS